MMRKRMPALLILLCASAAALAQSGAPPASRDPFQVPLLKPLPLAARTAALAAPSGKAPLPAWNPPLHGLMVAGPRSMANVGGVLLALGQSVDGYRLLAVRETEAEFTRQGQHFVLHLPQQQEMSPP